MLQPHRLARGERGEQERSQTALRSYFVVVASFVVASFVVASFVVVSFLYDRIAQSDHLVRLRSFTALDNVELDLIAFLQTFVAVDLNRAVVHKDVCSAFPPEKAVALRVIEPLDRTFVLRQLSALLTLVGCPISRALMSSTHNMGRMVSSK